MTLVPSLPPLWIVDEEASNDMIFIQSFTQINFFVLVSDVCMNQGTTDAHELMNRIPKKETFTIIRILM
jgi:hypothetical protein